jgi:hypothetical protein
MGEPKPRGGHRAGSGRKRLGHVALTLYLLPEVVADIRQAAAEAGVSPSKLIEAIWNARSRTVILIAASGGASDNQTILEYKAERIGGNTI